ncbi:MAG: hypothetical protein MUF83_16380 [Acidimicrobiales bacterium]|jgi:hypothetical protein|nr:hypothetical protein [Acidimicrobiales bacterium]
MLRRRLRPRTDDTNWGLRDDAAWHTEQARALPGAFGHLLSIPGAIVREARSMFSDDDAIAPHDPVLAPVHGVTFEQYVEVRALVFHRGVPAERHHEVAHDVGIAPGTWPAADAIWDHRREVDRRLAGRYATALERRLGELRETD